ncbi:MAG: Smr/MutS family protein [Acidobacteriota bacterium]|nr:Smr/MutS family protein [Acidobacteriota bacterium]
MSCCSAATSEALEFPSLLAVLAGFASTDIGGRAVRAIAPETDRDEIDRRRVRYAEIAREVERDGVLVPSLDGLLDLRDHLEGDGRGLGGPELLDLSAAIEASEEVLGRLESPDATPQCAAEVETLRRMEADAAEAVPPGQHGGGCAGLANRLRRMLNRRGEVRADATPRLRTLGRDARRAQASVEASVQAYVREHGNALADDSTPMRGGRLSVLLPSGSRGRLAGIVRGRSASGRSFYFEPSEVVEGNDELERIASERDVERTRILAELVAQVQVLTPAIVARIDFLAAVDAMQAAARFAVDLDAALVTVASDGPAGRAPLLELRGARHPLLDPRLADRRELALGAAGNRGVVVPLDLKLDDQAGSSVRRLDSGEGRSWPGSRSLVLTGPNAGGKTVALKTVGLLCLMNQAGLPVPAGRDSRLPILDHVVAVVGDEQSVLDEQSTFSARLLRLREVWRRAGPRTLVLLDEVGAGTNPEEGAALGIALLEGLVERGSLGILTTHLTQLAAAALESQSASCAAMGFDPQNGLPTYRLVVGPPGGSQALALARRLGLPPAWLERAEHFLGSEHQKLRRVLERNERLRERLLEREAELTRLSAETETARARFETRQESLRAARQRLEQTLGREVDALRRANRRRLDEALAELSSMPRGPGKRAFARAASSLHGELDRDLSAAADRASRAAGEIDPAPEREPEEPSQPEEQRPLTLGARVRHRSLGWLGELVDLRGDQATVLVRGKRVRTPSADLVAVAGGERPASGRVRVQRSQADPVEAELLLIGQQVEPALESLDAYLDRALAAGHERVRVVHGHGSGRLRRAVRTHLRDHPAVAGFDPAPPASGGDGATEVLLR